MPRNYVVSFRLSEAQFNSLCDLKDELIKNADAAGDYVSVKVYNDLSPAGIAKLLYFVGFDRTRGVTTTPPWSAKCHEPENS